MIEVLEMLGNCFRILCMLVSSIKKNNGKWEYVIYGDIFM